MSGVILSNLKKNGVSISNRFPEVHKCGTHTRTHALTHARRTHARARTHTHTLDDSIQRNAMRCISPKNRKRICKIKLLRLIVDPRRTDFVDRYINWTV